MGTIENRQQPRAAIELRVEYTRLNVFFADYTKNLSKGGTFIKTATPVPVGTRFKFQLIVPAFEKPVDLDGEVTWLLEKEAAAQQKSEPGMGVRFIFSSPEAQAQFEGAVEQLMKENFGEELASQLLGKPRASAG